MSIPMSYREIADDLAKRIAAGEYKAGDRLPTYTELNQMYSIGGSTAARVYALLTDRGLVVGKAGRGVFVKPSGAAGPPGLG